jgi:predicted TIM-barrel enzyme
VATTSGDKTGSPPDAEKLKLIKSYLDNTIPLAVASGVDENNVSDFLPFVDKFLVASSITERKSEYNNQEYFVPEKVSHLGNKIHSWKP